MLPGEFYYLVIVAFVVAFADNFANGANDVANAFAPSVAARTLTMKQAVLIALFTEFGGAVLLGSNTATTIRGIVRSESFAGNPDVLMLALVCSLIASASWVLFSCRRGWPISSSHSIVAALVGTAIPAFGWGSVRWGMDRGFARIATSWVLSPICGGVVSAILFHATRALVLRAENSFERAKKFMPLFFFFGGALNSFFIVFESPYLEKTFGDSVFAVLGVSIGIGFVFALWSIFFYTPWVVRIIENNEDLRVWHLFYMPFVGPRPRTLDTIAETAHVDEKHADKPAWERNADTLNYIHQRPERKGFLGRMKSALLHGVEQDVNTVTDEGLRAVHSAAERYDARTEHLYTFLQVFTAMCASFAHGANDVANGIGPLASVIEIHRTGKIPRSAPIPIELLAFGGLAIDAGLFFYGYNVIKTLGNKLMYHSPSRGFCFETGAALTVLTAAKLGLPVSSSQCLVGSAVGVAISTGNWRTVNWRKLGVIFVTWVLTVPVVACLSAGIFSFAAYAPSV
ncbi:phosphate transporter [Catenaria anguillulae PL171]|uniref:Phosphate transporter n=1 Tax=Catenaria anguillulae PL171 TaxID=765915 RepID=A0A1Y2HMR1_9FUNG|nr:phosphate transporter [Catenaria anguillulae PL171]